MKIPIVLLAGLATISLSASASAQAGGVGGNDGIGGAAAGGPATATYFKDATTTNFPADPCNDPANLFKLGCYTNFLVISDIDGDGDPDIAFANGGGYYVPEDYNGLTKKSVSGLEPSVVYLNNGSGVFSDATMTSFGGPMSRLRQVAIADVDGDGDLDVYQPGGYGLDSDKLFIQIAKATFVDQAAARLPAGLISRAGGAHFGDLDGDGDMDLVVADWGLEPFPFPVQGQPQVPASKGNTWVYLNDGTGVFTALPASTVPPPIASTVGRTPIDVDLADVDGDFDLDILVNHRNGQSRIFLNDGKAKFNDGTEGNYPQKGGPYTYNVEACDFDEDGDLDMLLDNAGPATEEGNISQVLVNDGTGKFTDETTTTISGEPYADDNAVKCADINGDGHYDLLVASLTVTEKLLLNDGAGKFAYVEGAFPEVTDPTLGIDVADLDGDGKLDVVTGQGEATPRSNLLYMGDGLSVKDKTPPKFRAVEIPTGIPGEPTVFRVAVTDSYTSETGEEVKEVYAAYTLNGGREVLKAPGKFIGGDLFRVVIPAQPIGTTIEITPTAIDHVDLTGTAPVITLAIGMLGEGGAAGDSAGGAAGEPIGGGPSGGSPSAGSPGSDAGEAGTGVGGGGSTKDDDGCGCSVAGQPKSQIPLLAGLGLAFLAFRRKRGGKKAS